MNTNRVQRIGCWLGSISLAIAIPSAILAIAPFTAAFATIVITVPLGILAMLMNAKRTGALTILWAVLAVVSLPNMPQAIGIAALALWLTAVVAVPVMWQNYRNQVAQYQ